MALAPTTISPGQTFDAPAPLTPGQQQTAAQLQAAGATSLPMAERPGSSTDQLPADAVSMDATGRVRVGPYAPAASEPMDDEYVARAEARDIRAMDAEQADLEQEAREIEAANQPQPTMGQRAVTVGSDFLRGVMDAPVAAVEGAKLTFNEALDTLQSAGDAVEQFVPGTIVWGPDGVKLTTRVEAEKAGVGTAPGRMNTAGADKIETNTGKFIMKASQFVTGFVGAGKILKGWSAAGKVGALVKPMVQGAIADFAAFDPHEERLSNMLAEVAPDQAKPIFEFMAAKAEDPEIVGRAKNALEGLGLGVATDSVFAGLRTLRAARAVKAAAKAEAEARGFQVDPTMAEAALDAEGAQVVKDATKMLKPNFTRKVDAAAATAPKPGVKPKEITGATIEPNVFAIDFSKIETPDDIKAAISTMLERDVSGVDAARGGTQSWASTAEKADGLDWVASMAARRPGQAANAAEITAYRGALNSSGKRLLDLATEVQVNGSKAAQFAFRRQMAIHIAIQREFMGARAEAGRALQAFQMPVGTPARQLRQIDTMLAEQGGAATADELAAAVLKVAKRGDVAMNELVQVGGMAHSRAVIKAVYTNGLLSGLGTPLVNVAGNTTALIMNLVDRAAAPGVARALGDMPHVEAGEAGQLLAGYLGAVRDAFRMPLRDTLDAITFDAAREQGPLRALAPGLDSVLPEGIKRTGREEAGNLTFADQVNGKPLGAAAWRVDQDSRLGRFLDGAQMLVESPSNVNALADDFFRGVAARGELRAQAFRQTQRELREGVIERDGVRARMAEIMAAPPPHMLDAAEKEMRELTFTRADGEFERKTNAFRQMLDSRGPIPVGTLLMPFVRTPMNIMSTAMRHSPLAPSMARYVEDIAAGGARAEIAKAKWAVGTAAYAVLMDMAANGEITGGGPANPAQRDALAREDEFGRVSWQPYSIKVGDRWVNYERLDPLGTAMSLAAGFAEVLANEDWDSARDQTPLEIGGHVVGSLGHAFFDKTMLRTLFDTVQAITSKDTAKMETMLKDRATAFIPGSSALRMVRRGTDEYMRETSSVLDALRNSIPGLSNSLPPQRDLWGRERSYQSGLGVVYDAIAPVKTREAGGTAIDAEILANGVSVSMPSRSLSIDSETVSLKNRLDIYSDYVAFAGQPAFQKLNAVVTGNDPDSEFYFSLSDGPDGGKAAYIKDVIDAYRADARAMILELYATDLSTMAQQSRAARAEARDDPAVR